MAIRLRYSILTAMALASTAAESVAVMPGNDGFRVDNAVYVGKETQPTVRTTTIFLNGDMYDFMEQPQEAIVLEPEPGRFTLLSMVRRVRAELSTAEVAELTRQVRRRAAVHERAYLQFLAQPEFDERFDPATGVLTLDSAWMTYRVETHSPSDLAMARHYREFADWYSQMNTMLNPANPAPFARMYLNAVLADCGVLPAMIHLTLRPKRSFPPTQVTLRSEHDLVGSVGQPDLDRVAQAREFMSIFQLISFDEYRRNDLR